MQSSKTEWGRWYKVRLEELAEARSCSVVGHGQEFEFYFKCNGKPVENLSGEGTLIQYALKKEITMTEWRITGTPCYPNTAVQIIRGTMFPNRFDLNFVWQIMRVWIIKDLSKFCFHSLLFFYFSIVFQYFRWHSISKILLQSTWYQSEC